jgi:hypothetical protein
VQQDEISLSSMKGTVLVSELTPKTMNFRVFWNPVTFPSVSKQAFHFSGLSILPPCTNAERKCEYWQAKEVAMNGSVRTKCIMKNIRVYAAG